MTDKPTRTPKKRISLHRLELGYNIGALLNISAVLGVWFFVSYMGKQDARNRFILDDPPENTCLLHHIWDCVSAVEWFAAGILIALIYGITRLGYLIALIEDIRGRE